jgi:peptide/nickel transport system substrate-binding protein
VSYCCGDEVLSPIHDMNAKLMVFEPLLKRDSAGTLVGRLARSWEASPDYREWTYHLRTDVRWHDGVSFTAADVAFTIEIMDTFEDPDYRGFEAVTVHDDSTITIRSSRAVHDYQDWMVFYPKHLLEDLDTANLGDWLFWRRPVGNGAYRFVRLEPETSMEFEANPDFYLGAPEIGRVILRFSLDAGVTELLSGGVDVAQLHPAPVRGDPRFRVYHVWYPSSWVIYWKADRPPFDDAWVRRALGLALDRREITRAAGIPDEVPLIDAPYTPDQIRRGEYSESLPPDPDRARSLLAEAGWRDTDGDGLLDRDGMPFRFTANIRSRSSENMQGLESLGVLVQSQLRAIGIEMELLTVDPAVIFDRLESGDFEAVFQFLRPHPAQPWLRRHGLGTGGAMGYANPRLAALFGEIERTPVPAMEDSLYREVAEIFRRDAPVTYLHPMVRFTVAHRRVLGLASPSRADPVAYVDELRLAEDGASVATPGQD